MILRLPYAQTNFTSTPGEKEAEAGNYLHGAFYYNDCVYMLGTVGNTVILKKVNVLTGATSTTDLFNVPSGANDRLRDVYMCFDGSDYVGIVFYESQTGVRVYSYRMSTGVVALLITESTQSINATGIGTLGGVFYYSYSHFPAGMSIVGVWDMKSIAVTGGAATTIVSNSADFLAVGWKGNHIQGTKLYNTSRNANVDIPALVGGRGAIFLDDSGTPWKIFFLMDTDAQERSGSTLVNSNPFTANACFLAQGGVFPWRSDEDWHPNAPVETIPRHIVWGCGNGGWVELAPKGREII
jgi:hypothetical protein